LRLNLGERRQTPTTVENAGLVRSSGSFLQASSAHVSIVLQLGGLWRIEAKAQGFKTKPELPHLSLAKVS
jgi:hypothetical protein